MMEVMIFIVVRVYVECCPFMNRWLRRVCVPQLIASQQVLIGFMPNLLALATSLLFNNS
jgi:hypothetical protein